MKSVRSVMLKPSLTDTPLKKIVLAVGIISTAIAANYASTHGMTLYSVLMVAAVNLLFVWMALYQLTCLRNGKCDFFSQLLAVVFVSTSLSSIMYNGALTDVAYALGSGY